MKSGVEYPGSGIAVKVNVPAWGTVYLTFKEIYSLKEFADTVLKEI